MARPPRMSRPTRLLLHELLTAPRAWRHGYDLSQATALKSGTLYPLLIRLSDLGLLESRWEEPEREGRPPRHAYRLTPDGLALAKTLRSEASMAKLRLARAT
jgi:PadR family transcriptional regulator, regulatory protein PadR